MNEHSNHEQPRLAGGTEGEPRVEPDSWGGLLTPGEVAALLHVDANTVARWSNEGRLRAIRTPGGHRRYLAGDVFRLARNSVTARAAQRREAAMDRRPGTAPEQRRRGPAEPPS